ncbi:MAG: NADH-quinone oxidoreductase subunit J [Bacteroidia bacterium]|nr:NADH-quinone oxidoreductase subunit J [Bacteroidia bacterium]
MEAATTIQTVLFWTFSVLGLAGAVGLLFNRNAVYAALSLVLNFFSIAGLYLSLGAEFLAAVQILVYAGAIMVLFLFVIMLLNMQEEKGVFTFDIRRGAAFILGFAFVAEMMVVLKGFWNHEAGGEFTYGKVEPIGRALLTDYLFPFEMISIVLIAALIGAILVARRHTHQEG